MNKIYSLYDEITTYSSYPNGYNIFLDNKVDDDRIRLYLTGFYKNLNESFTEGTVSTEYINKDFKYGFEDLYSFIVQNKKFYTLIRYYNSQYILDFITNIRIQSLDNNDIFKDYEEYILNNKNKYIFYLSFSNDKGEKIITGDMKNYAHEVLGGVVRSCRQSYRHNKRFPNISSLYFQTDKTEDKRNKIYEMIIRSEWSNFKNKVVDDITNNKYVSTFYY